MVRCAALSGVCCRLSCVCGSVPQVLCITAAVALASWLAVGGCLLAAAPAVPFLAALERTELWAVASLGGTLAMARSPASAVSQLQALPADHAHHAGCIESNFPDSATLSGLMQTALTYTTAVHCAATEARM